MNQVEFLLRLSENARDQGDELARRHLAELEVHTKELQELYRMIEAAQQNVWAELSRWGALNEQKEPGRLAAQIQPQGVKAVRYSETQSK